MPHRTRIKICGVRDVPTALACAEAGADAVGLVFVEGSARHVSVEEARRIIQALPAFIEPVGLFVNAAPEYMTQVAHKVGLRQVQLHGSEPVSLARDLAPLSVLKAIGFSSGFHDAARAWTNINAPNLSGLIVDAAPPAGHAPGQAGGTGISFDWNALKAQLESFDTGKLLPLVLAGGLKPTNVANAITLLRPYAVDVSSGVESSRGVKSHPLIFEFCHRVRQADLS